MKAFVLIEPGKVGWHDAPEPTLTPYGAILRPVAVTPCSSDVHTVYGGGSRKAPNLILGHECVAEILEVGELVQDFKPGELVAVPSITPDWRESGIQEGNYKHASAPFSGHQLGRSIPGVFAEKFLIPDADTTLARIPEGVSIEQALMCVDVVTTGFTGAEFADIKIGDTVVVMGIGPIGLMAVEGARLLGAARILAVGSRPICTQLAKEFGATEVLSYKDGDIVSQVMERTDGLGADGVILCGGGDEVFSQAVDMARYGIGTISNVNYYGGTGSLAFPKFSGGRGMAGKTIHTELAKGGRNRIERLLKMIQYGRINPEKLVTHKLYGLDEVETALRMMKEKPRDLIKAMVQIDWK
ncbi:MULTISPECIES: zinc-binding dehydrogenase [Lacrimispora]|jgi:threonine dehydrogenase-like Zn-dependent dehydrogenase|uniref:Isopropanol dehydrogenase n=1 Tax=Lacrimispora algidixylanolytica TaxID=94868 RepID=A0A419TBF9_9FIRM|nr:MULTISPECIES: zinc-binding dehydrogenase [Lacrimispora]RKD34819.1 isopropanol dehydrogenase [Lacrimispora algidixylanolytica]